MCVIRNTSSANRRRRPAAKLRYSPLLTSAHRTSTVFIIAGREGLDRIAKGGAATMADTPRMTTDAMLVEIDVIAVVPR